MNTGSSLTYEFPEMQPDRRLQELILHIAKASEFNVLFGKTKLVKILYHADFTSFRLTGKPITGAKYIKLPNGPIPSNFRNLLNDMVSQGQVTIDKRIIPGYSHPQMRVVARREVDYSIFSAQEIARVDDVIRNLWNDSGTEVAESTHGIVWNVLELQEAIPYEAALVSEEGITEDDIAEIGELVQKYGREF